MESICLGLGESLYPAFLKLLGLIGSKGNDETQSLITDTLVQALLTGRLPSGHLTAWGMSKFPGERHFGQTRSLGPVEYLLTWYAQPSGKGPLPIQVFIINPAVKYRDRYAAYAIFWCSKYLRTRPGV
ncbi:MAG: hypothetical protein ABW068_14370, partial [Candidatus Thiodiazotropha sp.]